MDANECFMGRRAGEVILGAALGVKEAADVAFPKQTVWFGFAPPGSAIGGKSVGRKVAQESHEAGPGEVCVIR